MPSDPEEDALLRSVALQNARTILLARQRIEDQLAHSLAMLEATLESTADGLIVTDANGNVTGFNQRYVDMWRLPAELLQARLHRQLLPQCAAQFADPARFVARVDEIYATMPPETFDLLELADGRVYERVSIIQQVAGKTVGRVWSFRDITATKQIERALSEERERLRITLRSIADGVISTDANGCVTYLNGVAEGLTGWTSAEAAGRPLTDVFHIVHQRTRKAVENPALRALREGTVAGLANHTVLIARGGGEKAIDDSAAPMRDDRGTIVGAVLVFRDVSDHALAHEARARLATIVESSDDAIVSKTLDGVIRSWNVGAERIFGYTAEEAIGQAITLIIPPERAEEERSILRRLVRGERVDHFETVRVAKDGRLLHISLSVSPIRDAEGTVIGASKIARNISDRVRAEEELRDQHQVVETLYAIGARLAAELDLGRLLQAVTDETTALAGAAFGAFFYNAVDERGARYSLFTLSGAPREAFDRFPEPRATPIFEPTFAGKPTVRLADVTQDPRYGQNPPYQGMPPGHLPVKSYLAVPVKSRSGEVLGGLFFGHPEAGVFSERHERLVAGVAAQAAVAIDNARLYEQLKLADQRKEEFLATLAHELRNPLAPIRTGLEILKLGGGEAVQARARGMMDRQLTHMFRLVDDLLDVSRISRGKIDLRKETIDLRAIVESALETSRPVIDEAGHGLVVNLAREPLPLEADPTRLAQVVANLLNNAAKYTLRGGRIEIATAREGGDGLVCVRDNGEGIPREMLGPVFDMFLQLGRSHDRSRGGLGIGLTLVRRLVEMHGGTVVAESPGVGQGSSFTVRLPLAAARDASAGTATAASGGADALRVLVVDDNPDAAQSLALFLDLAGHVTRIAYSGPDALEAATQFAPHVVLLDIGLPGMDGYEVARRLRASAPAVRPLIVALTGWGSEEDRQQAVEAGCDFHLTKPADLEQVQALLAQHRDSR